MHRSKYEVVPSVTAALLAAACSSGSKSSPGGGPDAAQADSGRGAGIYVTNAGGVSVTVFALGASGNAVPVRTIAGSNTGLASPLGIGVDSLGNVYVANRSAGTVTVYGPSASGNTAPERTITAQGMGAPEGIAIGPSGDLYVSTCPGCDGGNGNIGVYHFPSQASLPDHILGGDTNTNTGLTAPGSIVLDSNQNLIVGNSFGGAIEIFAEGATGDVAPLRTFTPSSSNLQGLAVGMNTIFVADPSTGIQEYPESQTAGDGGLVTPAFTIPGDAFPIKYPGELAIDTQASPAVLYAVDFSGNTVFVAPTSGSLPDLTVMSVVPIQGPATTMNEPFGVAVFK
ncbi:MAG TPA: hypothetical protein VEK07_11580 [Polyangiaceae bacterium]|nr:hypothetical protein [Polyangiaceae bacterium]